MKFNRIFVIVYDSLGIGDDPRASEFDNEGANTYKRLYDTNKLNAPTLDKLGINQLIGVSTNSEKIGLFSRMIEKSTGKDTIVGHWEMMGILTKKQFPVFIDNGFPQKVIDDLEKKWGRKIIGNKYASGTVIIDELAEQEIKNGNIIVYTSPDSNMQICGHEKYTGLDNLYKFCEIARKYLSEKPETNVARIIARPYVGEKVGEFLRTSNRKDYPIDLPQKSVLDVLKESGIETISIGKIYDIFNGNGIVKKYKGKNNIEHLEQTIDVIKQNKNNQFVFVNLVDFDSLYGHRRDILGYTNAVNESDPKLKEIIELINDDDLVIVTADHGNDPGWPGADHTRETVPLLIYSKSLSRKSRINDIIGFDSIGATILENFGIKIEENIFEGKSFLNKIE